VISRGILFFVATYVYDYYMYMERERERERVSGIVLGNLGNHYFPALIRFVFLDILFCPHLSAFLAICNILKLETPISTVFATFWSSNN